MWTPASGVRSVVDAMNKFTRTAEVLWRKRREKGRHGHSLNERTPRPLPGQAFIAFWEHYIKEGSHSLCSGLL